MCLITKVSSVFFLAISMALGATVSPASEVPDSPRSLKLHTPASFLPGIPFLVRIELLQADGSRAKGVWDATALLGTPTPGIQLSTNSVRLWNGMGSALVTVTNNTDFELEATLEALRTHRTLVSKASAPVTTVAGPLPGTNATWSGIIRVTADVVVPTTNTLTIEPDTLVLLNGATSNPNGIDIEVRGRMLALGTQDQPITFTASTNGMNWGEIRHTNAAPSVYQWCHFTRAGRGNGGGHTGTAPTFRPTNSGITFESCSITDNTAGSPTNTVGKVMQASGSELVMNNCLWARARMGPEIGSSSLLLTNSYVTEMLGPDDCDGIYLHSQRAGQDILLVDSVFAYGHDDGIDTLGSTITVQNCIVRNWKNPAEDSKGISIFGGEVRLWHSLVVDSMVAISGKANTGERVGLKAGHCTILGIVQALAVTNKSGTTPIIDYRLTNSIVRAEYDSVFTSYPDKLGDIHIEYSNVGEVWTNGTANFTNTPAFANETAHDYRLQPYSPCIDAGDPASPADSDGSPTDAGCFTFQPPPPSLGEARVDTTSVFQFSLAAYTNRFYRIEWSTNCLDWQSFQTVFPTNEVTPLEDPAPSADFHRFYRARLGP